MSELIKDIYINMIDETQESQIADVKIYIANIQKSSIIPIFEGEQFILRHYVR